MSLKGQIALVTGAGQGIGAAILKVLAAKGATVIGGDINAQAVENINAMLADLGAHGCGILLDVRNAEHIEAGVAFIEKEYGPVSILVNNAGITRDNLAMRMKDEEWDLVIDINLKAVFRMSRAVMRGMMKARAGRIINISSVVGYAGNAGQANYCATKAGVAGMGRALARELGSRSITVNCVAPGFIETDMTANLPEEQQKALQSQIALGHLGKPADIAHAVAYLASREAGYVTGQELHVNGGMYM